MAKHNEVVKEDDDKTQKIFGIILVLLVIISLVVLFIVGCDRKEPEENKKEPDKQEVIDDKKEDITLDTNTTNNNLVQKTNNETTEEVANYYNVTYKFYELVETEEGQVGKLVKTSSKKVKEGNKVEFVTIPNYEDFTYYLDENFETIMGSEVVTGDTTIYVTMKKTEVPVQLRYVIDENNSNTVELTDSVDLPKVTSTGAVILGWYLDDQFVAEVTNVDMSLTEFAVDNTVTIYAKVVESVKFSYVYGGEEIFDETKTGEELTNGYEVLDTTTITDYIKEEINERVLGYSTDGSQNITYTDGDIINDYSETVTLHVIVGSTTVTYISIPEVEEITVGYSQEELENWEVPTPADLGLELPDEAIESEQTDKDTMLIVPETVTGADFDSERMIHLAELLARKDITISEELRVAIEEVLATGEFYEISLIDVEVSGWRVQSIVSEDESEITVGDELAIGGEYTLPAGADIIVEIVIPESEKVEEEDDSTEVADNGEAEEPTVPEEA